MISRPRLPNCKHLLKVRKNIGDTSVQYPQAINTELNDLRKIICLRKNLFLLKEFQFIKSLKNLVEHMLHLFNDFILSAMLLHQ